MTDLSPTNSNRRRWEMRSWWARLLVGKHPVRTLARAAVFAILIIGAAKWCFVPTRVTGHSMEPTYQNGRLNLLNLLAYRKSEPRRGDVVGIRKTGYRMVLMKRVLGLPGEKVQVMNGMVHINGAPLDEPYASGRGIPSMADPIRLDADQYFVIGDNRNVSEYGLVRRHEILGKLML